MIDFERKFASIQLYVGGVWSKKQHVMLVAWITCLIGWSLVALIDNRYETKAKVYADTTSTLKPLLQGLIVDGDSRLEVQTASRTFLSRDVLEDIAKSSDLYLEHPTPEEYEIMLKELKEDIKITGTTKYNIYDIQYQSKDPKMALKIVELTLKKFVDANASRTRKDSVVATNFLDNQIEEFKQRLERSENELANFRRKNKDYLPGQGTGYYSSVSRLKEEIEKLELLLTEKTSEINGLKSRFLPGNEQFSESVKTRFDERLETMRGSLEELRIRYTEKHPDITELNRRIAAMEKLQQEERRNIISSASNGTMASSGDGDNLVLQQFSLRLSELEAQRDVLKTRKLSMNNKLNELDEKLDLIPKIEAELVELQRNYTNDQSYYQQLIKRRDSAEMSKNADEKTDDVKFRILDEPRESTIPVGPPRSIFYIVLFLMGGAIGILSAFVRVQLQNIISTRFHLEELVGEQNVIGSISHLQRKKIKFKRRVSTFFFTLNFLTLTSLLVILVAHEFKFRQSPIIWLLQ